jgi:hypothetical protein
MPNDFAPRARPREVNGHMLPTGRSNVVEGRSLAVLATPFPEPIPDPLEAT